MPGTIARRSPADYSAPVTGSTIQVLRGAGFGIVLLQSHAADHVALPAILRGRHEQPETGMRNHQPKSSYPWTDWRN